MRWLTHQVGAVGAALWLQLPDAALAAAWFGGVLPDLMDQKFAGLFRDRQKAFNRTHRGLTHWPGLWLGLALAALALGPSLGAEAARPLLAGLFVGGLSHVVLDMLTPQGVPLLPFTRKKRFSLKLCKTGSWGERLFLLCMLGAGWLFLREDIAARASALARPLLGI